MPVVRLQSRHLSVGTIDWTHDARGITRPRGPYEFVVDEIRIVVDPIAERFTADVVVELSQEALDSLDDWQVTRHLRDHYHHEVAPIVDQMSSAVRRFVENLCFTYPMHCLNGERLEGVWFSLDEGNAWEEAPISGKALRLGTISTRKIDESSLPVIQAQLDTGVRPLEAFRHLQRAEQERDPRHKWIDTAIAAELGIKEFLARREPKLVSLLLEVPSPPLAKLYGPVLAAYDGTPSKWAARLQDCANRRNDLVHKHTSASPDAQHAADFVNLVTATLYDLMARLYPDDATLEELRADKVDLVDRDDARKKKLREEAQRAEKQRKREANRPDSGPHESQ